MAKIIHYDFRKEERHRLMQEIYLRTNERMLAFSRDCNYYNNEEVRKLQQMDTQLINALEAEELQWAQTGEKWVEDLDKELI